MSSSEKLNFNHDDFETTKIKALENFTFNINKEAFSSINRIAEATKNITEPLRKLANSQAVETLNRVNANLTSPISHLNISSAKQVSEIAKSISGNISNYNHMLEATDAIRRFAEQQDEILSKYKSMNSGLEKLKEHALLKTKTLKPSYDSSYIFENMRQEAEDRATERTANKKIIELYEEFVSTTKALEKSVEIQNIQFEVMQAMLDEHKASRADEAKRDIENKTDSRRNFILNAIVLILAILGLIASGVSIYYAKIQYEESKSTIHINSKKPIYLATDVLIPYLPETQSD